MGKGRKSVNFKQKSEDNKGRTYCRVFKFWLKPMDWVIKLKDGLKPVSIDVS
ncbi:hypothetical protein SAMN05444407_107246 [Chryseobacterium contaminans]|uniref:Uncharacterized protein n=1 Tax=Chryseobacterium contaminans TaxID=1423959 RepID=A0A1M7ENC7_9FLAO|nr:hypothetical protein SAMN05444407_107246 [Chryseobacterium contaminans]